MMKLPRLRAALETWRGLGWIYGLGLLVAFLSFLLFVNLAGDVVEGETRALDSSILRQIHDRQSPLLDAIALGLTLLGGSGGTAVVSLGAAFLLASRKRTSDALTLITAVSGASLLVVLLKLTFQQERPRLFPSLLPAPGYSFPSGHAVMAVTLYGTLALLVLSGVARAAPRIAGAVLLVALSLGIVWSRLYLSVHWPSDVAAGTLMACFWVAVCHLARHHLEGRRTGSSPCTSPVEPFPSAAAPEPRP